MSKKSIFWLGLIAVALLVASWWRDAIWGKTSESSASVPPPPASAAEEALRVETHLVSPRPLEELVTLTGELRASEEVALRSEVNGRITEIHFAEGRRVARGDVLVKINDAELRAELHRAELRQDLARRREDRARTLLAEETLSQEIYDQTASDLRVLEAEIELIRTRIEQTEVRAPFSGVIGLRRVSVGSYLTPQTEIATLQSLDPIKIDFSAAEGLAGRISPGNTLSFEVAGLEESFTGRVYAVEPSIDAATRTVRIRARAGNPERRLMPGAFARVSLVLGVDENALLVPSIALIPGLATTSVYVLVGEEAQLRTVRTGQREESQVQILEGLEAGEMVITSGLQQLSTGQKVRSL